MERRQCDTYRKEKADNEFQTHVFCAVKWHMVVCAIKKPISSRFLIHGRIEECFLQPKSEPENAQVPPSLQVNGFLKHSVSFRRLVKWD